MKTSKLARPATAFGGSIAHARPRPRPVIDLKGRDPAEFNRSMHFVAEIEEYAKSIGRANLDLLLPGLTPEEAGEVSRHIANIDAVHDRIITRCAHDNRAFTY